MDSNLQSILEQYGDMLVRMNSLDHHLCGTIWNEIFRSIGPLEEAAPPVEGEDSKFNTIISFNSDMFVRSTVILAQEVKRAKLYHKEHG